MAHPYHIPIGNHMRKKNIYKLNKSQLHQLDGVEVENGHNRAEANLMAHRLAEIENLPSIAGSDAHFPLEIGNASSELSIAELSLETVYQALSENRVKVHPRHFNAFPIYLIVAGINRLKGKKYAWKQS